MEREHRVTAPKSFVAVPDPKLLKLEDEVIIQSTCRNVDDGAELDIFRWLSWAYRRAVARTPVVSLAKLVAGNLGRRSGWLLVPTILRHWVGG